MTRCTQSNEVRCPLKPRPVYSPTRSVTRRSPQTPPYPRLLCRWEIPRRTHPVGWLAGTTLLNRSSKRGSSVHSSLAEQYTPFGSVKLLSPPSRGPAGIERTKKEMNPVREQLSTTSVVTSPHQCNTDFTVLVEMFLCIQVFITFDVILLFISIPGTQVQHLIFLPTPPILLRAIRETLATQITVICTEKTDKITYVLLVKIVTDEPINSPNFYR